MIFIHIAYNMSYMTVNIYKAQDVLLDKIFRDLNRLRIPHCILAGGTALARFYLHHRISYDLDFFVAGGFSPDNLSVLLGKRGIVLRDVHIESGGTYVNQMHGYTESMGATIKVSFVEDVYDGMWPTVKIGNVVTEHIEGLYHRKLRTVSGSGYGKDTRGARQTARDLFDIYVLSKQIKPLHVFIEAINNRGANFPQDAFCSNLLKMPWMDMMEEFERLERLKPYEQITLMRDIKGGLDREVIKLQHISGNENDEK